MIVTSAESIEAERGMVRFARSLLQKIRHNPGPATLVAILLCLIGFSIVVIGRYSWASYELDKGRGALEQRQFPEANEHLERSLRLWETAEAHLRAARAARYVEDYDRAETHFQAYQRLIGKNEALALERALMLAQRGALDPTLEQYLQKCVVEHHVDTDLILEALAAGYIKLFRVPNAAFCLQAWINRQPQLPDPLVVRGQLWARLQHLDRAEEDYRKALELDPEHVVARLNLAGTLESQTRASEAVSHYEYLHDRHPDDPRVVLGLTHCYLTLGRTDEARPLLEALLVKYPGESLALAERGHLAYQSGQIEEAADFFQQVIAQDPFDQEAFYVLAQCQRRLGRPEEAKRSLVRSEQIKSWFNDLGEAMMRMLDEPNNAELRYRAGRIFFEMGLEEQGVTWYLAGLREDPSHLAINRALADYYERTGQKELAVQYRQAAMSQHGNGAATSNTLSPAPR
jgi:tetratricopeptide (TPR) repeat protein